MGDAVVVREDALVAREEAAGDLRSHPLPETAPVPSP
jgi:hypothetical protein